MWRGAVITNMLFLNIHKFFKTVEVSFCLLTSHRLMIIPNDKKNTYVTAVSCASLESGQVKTCCLLLFSTTSTYAQQLRYIIISYFYNNGIPPLVWRNDQQECTFCTTQVTPS